MAHALEAALEGSLAEFDIGLRTLWRAMLNPELWAAAQWQRRAKAMAWMPGLVLDYAHTLQAAIQPTPLGWSTLFAQSSRFWHSAQMVRRREPMRRIEKLGDNERERKTGAKHP